MELFANNEVAINSLPKVEELELKPISPKYIYIIIINTLVSFGIAAGAIIFVNLFAKDDGFKAMFWYLISILGVIFFLTIIFGFLGFKKRKYAIREHDITFSKGYLVNKTLTLPYNRIQHLEITRTFLARKLGLSTLKIYTAGESGGDMTIKGLPKAVAEKQYGFLTKVINERV